MGASPFTEREKAACAVRESAELLMEDETQNGDQLSRLVDSMCCLSK